MSSVLLLADGSDGGGSFDAAAIHVPSAADAAEDSYHFNSSWNKQIYNSYVMINSHVWTLCILHHPRSVSSFRVSGVVCAHFSQWLFIWDFASRTFVLHWRRRPHDCSSSADNRAVDAVRCTFSIRSINLFLISNLFLGRSSRGTSTEYVARARALFSIHFLQV